MTRRGLTLAVLLVFASLGGECGGGSGRGGSRNVIEASSLDPRCQAIGTSPFPPGFEFDPGRDGGLLALSSSPGQVLAVDGRGTRPILVLTPPVLSIPDDSDGDGVLEGSPAENDTPILDGIFTRDPDLADAGLALLTASDYEEVIFEDPARGTLVTVEVEVPAGVPSGDYPKLPAPGSLVLRTAISTQVCIRPSETIDSAGVDYAEGLPDFFFCDPGFRGSFFANFTSGAAVAAGRLFVSTSNAGGRLAQPDTQWLPGTVLVYDLDLAADPPRVSVRSQTPFLETSAFNPTDVTRVEVGGREFVLVSATGGIGIPQDDPDTPDDVEGGTLVLTDASIDVIDPESLHVVGRYPLGPAGLAFDGPSVDPSGRVAAIGSEAGRWLFAVDLAALPLLPVAPAEPVDLSPYVLFDAAAPLVIPGLPAGAPVASCPGNTSGVAWNAAGDRLYVVDRCDGSLTRVLADLPADPADPIFTGNFAVLGTEPLVAPLRDDTLGQVRDLGFLRVRPGRPGIDFEGPEVFFTVNQPIGAVCAVRIASP